jgi:hypothetical protein
LQGKNNNKEVIDQTKRIIFSIKLSFEIKLHYFVIGFRLAASLVFGVAGLQQQNQNLPARE